MPDRQDDKGGPSILRQFDHAHRRQAPRKDWRQHEQILNLRVVPGWRQEVYKYMHIYLWTALRIKAFVPDRQDDKGGP